MLVRSVIVFLVVFASLISTNFARPEGEVAATTETIAETATEEPTTVDGAKDDTKRKSKKLKDSSSSSSSSSTSASKESDDEFHLADVEYHYKDPIEAAMALFTSNATEPNVRAHAAWELARRSLAELHKIEKAISTKSETHIQADIITGASESSSESLQNEKTKKEKKHKSKVVTITENTI